MCASIGLIGLSASLEWTHVCRLHAHATSACAGATYASPKSWETRRIMRVRRSSESNAKDSIDGLMSSNHILTRSMPHFSISFHFVLCIFFPRLAYFDQLSASLFCRRQLLATVWVFVRSLCFSPAKDLLLTPVGHETKN